MGRLKIAVSSGELSGDEHAAALASALRSMYGGVEIRGMGGTHSRAAGIDTVVDSESSASVMGFQEVVLSFGKILGAYRRMQELLSSWRPDLLVVIDYPDFHFRLLRYARSLGIKVLYFIPPQIWAWRSGRARFLAENADALALIFPFERAFYESRGVTHSVYVGHPFTNLFAGLAPVSRDELLRSIGLMPDNPTLAILPGSRRSEIQRLLPTALETFSRLRSRRKDIQGVIPVASPALRDSIAPHAAATEGLALFEGRSLDLLRAADAGLQKSGTSNLQSVFAGLPFSMFYKAPLLSELIVRLAVNVDQYSIVNLIRRGTVRELLQREANPAALAAEAERLLFDETYRSEIGAAFGEVKEMLASHDQDRRFEGCASPYERAAGLALSLV